MNENRIKICNSFFSLFEVSNVVFLLPYSSFCITFPLNEVIFGHKYALPRSSLCKWVVV